MRYCLECSTSVYNQPFTNEKTDWPVFTITLYKAGYKTASVDVVLYKYIY